MRVLRSILSGVVEVLRSFRGALLVQIQSLGFYQGRQFRFYREFTSNTVLQFSSTKPFILQHQSLYTDAGAARVAVVAGGTATGGFTVIPNQPIAKWRINAAPVSAVTMSVGGTFTGGLEREILRTSSGTGGNAQGDADIAGGERGLPAGNYFITITVSGTTSGMYTIAWEELD